MTNEALVKALLEHPGYGVPQSVGPLAQAVYIALGGTFISGVYVGVKALWRNRAKKGK